MPELVPGHWDLNWKRLKTGSAAVVYIHLAVMRLPASFLQYVPLMRPKKKARICSACHHVIKRVNDDMKNVEDIRTKANNYMQLDEPYAGETKVLHFLEVLRDEIGFDKLKEKVVNPLTGKKIGAYYGCLLLRPGKILEFDNPENPKILEDFIRAIGAEPVIYPYRNECCGGYISLKEKDMAKNMCNNIVDSADGFGAEMLITACPLCMYNLKKSTDEKLPVKYFTELLAEALGVKEEVDKA